MKPGKMVSWSFLFCQLFDKLPQYDGYQVVELNEHAQQGYARKQDPETDLKKSLTYLCWA